MTLSKWESRAEITAQLINPAFCVEIIKEFTLGFNSESNLDLPYSLSVLILPFILSANIRNRLPVKKNTTLHRWITNNEVIKIGLAKKISSFNSFTREAIMFGLLHDTLKLSSTGCLQVGAVKRAKTTIEDEEVIDCLKKANTLGKVFSKSGIPSTIYSILGIKP